MKRLFLISFIFLLSSCSGRAGLNLAHYPDPDATKDAFTYCHGYSCSRTLRVGFSNHEWKQISKIFQKKSKTAKEERLKIAQAIALMETYTGKLAGTSDDLAKAPIRRVSFQELDCIDETINTTKYLKFMADAKFLKFHTVGFPAYKGGFVNGVYPHNTATIKEIATGEEFAIDSYIYKNGERPNIRGLDNWLNYRVEEVEKAHQLHKL